MPAVETLVGREPELKAIHELVDGVGEHGRALVVRGEAGIGKSALLAEASRYATGEGLGVLSATAVQSEARLPFAGLHQLLRPVLAGADELPKPQRAALRSAFGMEDGARTDAFLVALGALELLSDRAARSPLLVVVEDAHWLDDPTSDVVSFIARRIESEPIILLIATREDGLPSEAGLEDLNLSGLTEGDAGALLDVLAPELAPEVRRRLLDEARGNPLALVELPGALAYEQLHGQELLPENLPLTDKLERAFETRAAELPDDTRRVLVFAAADDGGLVREVLGAAGSTLEKLEPALAAGLVEFDHERLRFHHPLVRSAIYQAAGAGERQAAHAALARQVADDPDRSIWHRAAAAGGPDEQLADDLLLAAVRARDRGAPLAAVAALERAAELTADERERGALYIQAAEAEWELGRIERSMELLAKAKTLDLRPHERLRLEFLVEVFDEANWTGATRAGVFAELAKELMATGRPDEALRALEVVSLRSYWGNPDQETRNLIVEAADALAAREDDPALLAVLAHADTAQQGARVLRVLTRRKPVETDAGELLALAMAANAVWSFDISAPFADQAVDGLRAQGRLGPLAQALALQAWAAVHLANAPVALSAADEAMRLASETRQLRWKLAAQMAKAAIVAERGELDEAEKLSAEVEAALLQMGANPLLAFVQFARGRGAVAHQFFSEGRDHLQRIFDPADTAYHPLVGALSLGDLVEACIHVGDRDGAEMYLTRLQSLSAQVPGTLLLAQLAYARAIVADDEETYQEGLGSSLATWPCYRGRLLLAYGAWLRRHRRVAESRAPLRAAREIFEGLGFRAIAERARQELRASGETSRKRTRDAWDQLSPQELQIARMAAEGLTNREIAQKLYLSHRTVGSHLYRMFPKLGITSRGQLGAALQSSD
jgi:DNA-binding CsgD family transcriptional regulator/tetratricopeptide (TPR) repeat protein